VTTSDDLLVATDASVDPGGADAMLVVDETGIAHLFANLIIHPARDAWHRTAWSRWRRRHQHRAQTCHYQRQATQDHEHNDLRLEYQEGQNFADGRFLSDGLWQWEVRLDPVAVAAAVFLLDDVPGCGQVGDDAVGATSAMPTLAAMSRSRTPGSWAMHSRTRAWLVRELQLSILRKHSFTS
jgi:hypothetical protein